jgi:hypothetical protein
VEDDPAPVGRKLCPEAGEDSAGEKLMSQDLVSPRNLRELTGESAGFGLESSTGFSLWKNPRKKREILLPTGPITIFILSLSFYLKRRGEADD